MREKIINWLMSTDDRTLLRIFRLIQILFWIYFGIVMGLLGFVMGLLIDIVNT